MSDIVIYGSGKTGQSLMKMLQKLNKTAVFFDDCNGFENHGNFSKNSLVLMSPGISPHASGYRTAQKSGAKIVGELEFCFPYCRGKCISVTGTNGKTTVCEMIHKILSDCQMPNRLLGNGGVPFSSQVLETSTNEITVLESSSFQLYRCENFAPYVSVLTNLAPDHIDWHGNFDEYCNAKKNNFVHQTQGYAIFNLDDERSVKLSKDSRVENLFFSVCNETANCYWQNGNVILQSKDKNLRLHAPDFAGFARHNLSNALAAVLACACVGAPAEKAVAALSEFQLLPHRLQQVDCFDGVEFVNDSKATNVHATVSAISGYTQNLALILGGSDKMESYDAIFTNIKPNTKTVVAVGQTAKKISDCGAKHGCEVVIAEDFKQAVKYCFHLLKPIGGVVLMSNACASFDSFHSFEERGEYFVKAVEEIKLENKTN